VNNSYFKSSASDTSPCAFTVCKINSDISQIRLDFDTFNIAGPSTIKPGDSLPNSRTQCLDAQFSTTSDGPVPPVICGNNQGMHMLIEAKDSCNTLTFNWPGAYSKDWNIKISQFERGAAWKAPEGCTQWFTGTSNYIQSYNYDGGYHLADQKYTNCIRTEQSYCSIGYTGISDTSFRMSSINLDTSPINMGLVGDSCVGDRILIAGGGTDPGGKATFNYDRFCGGLLTSGNVCTSMCTSASASTSPGGTTLKTVYSNKMPFQLQVFTDGTELDVDDPSAAAGVEWSEGFRIYYSQESC